MANQNVDTEKLLSDKRVVAEIQRHLWIESEKAGFNIGFEKAKEDWLEKFSRAWMSYNMPESLVSRNSKPAEARVERKANDSQSIKRRRAKSYMK